MVSDGTSLFWTMYDEYGGQFFVSMPVGGGTVTKLSQTFAQTSVGADELVVDATNIYGPGSSGLVVMPRKGTKSSLWVYNVNAPNAVASDGTTLFGVTDLLGVSRYPIKTPSQVQVDYVKSSSLYFDRGLRVKIDADSVYFLAQSGVYKVAKK